MGFPILVRRHLNIESGSCILKLECSQPNWGTGYTKKELIKTYYRKISHHNKIKYIQQFYCVPQTPYFYPYKLLVKIDTPIAKFLFHNHGLVQYNRNALELLQYSINPPIWYSHISGITKRIMTNVGFCLWLLWIIIISYFLHNTFELTTDMQHARMKYRLIIADVLNSISCNFARE